MTAMTAMTAMTVTKEKMKGKKGFLFLEDGNWYQGHLTYPCEGAGELVFNTSHSGYEEVASDPSYFGQILVMTFPMQGNYATHPPYWQSHRLWASGLVCLQMQSSSRDRQWFQALQKENIPLLIEVDTRKVVLHLRHKGTLWAAIVAANSPEEARQKGENLILQKKKELSDKDWSQEVSVKEKRLHKGDKGDKGDKMDPSLKEKGPVVALLDFGCKKGILEEVQLRSAEVNMYPPTLSSLKELKKRKQSSLGALFLSNGPGDPANVSTEIIEGLSCLIGKWPTMGICFGHQLLGRALGASTQKLKFGHRGSNHPVQDKLLNKTYITSQNHGYVINAGSLPPEVERTHWNLNDQSLAGFLHREKACLGVQFHPESCPGPRDGAFLFNYFFEKVLLPFSQG